MTTPGHLPSIYRFADLTLDAARRCVTRQGRPIELKALDFDLLRFLVESAPDVVNGDVLAEKVWGRHFVSPENVAQRVMLLRQSLGDDANRPRYIETVRNKGYRLIPVVERAPADESGTVPRRRGLVPAAAALLLAVGFTAAASYWLAGTVELAEQAARRDQAPTLPGFANRPAIAVLPFEVFGSDPEQQHVADAITEDLTTRLAGWGSFPVIARSSTFVYKGKAVDSRQIGREIAARYLVEGSMRRTRERRRISARLIDATSGVQIWAQSYDREVRDIFALQTEISESIVGALYPELMRFEGRRSMAKPPENLDAWESAHRAWGHFLRLTADDNEQARVLFQRSVELDSTWSWSHAGLALTYHQRVANGWSELSEDDTATLLRLAERAVQLDDHDAAAHHALGHAYELSGRQEEMIAAFQRGVALNPSDSIAHSCLGRSLAYAGRSEEAIFHLEQAIRLSPQDPWTFLSLFGVAAAHLAAARYEEAIDWALRSTRWQPNPAAYRALAVSYANLGRLDEARKALREMHHLQPQFSLTDLDVVFASADREFVERVYDGLRMAGLE